MKRVPLRKQTKLYAAIRRKRMVALMAKGYILKEEDIPTDAIPADMELQAAQNTYGPRIYYEDKPFKCIDCGKKEVWTAEQQMHWYEILKGNINSSANRCRLCRKTHREQLEIHRAKSLAGYEAKKRKTRLNRSSL